MADPVCPQCHATLDADVVESTGITECPFCGEDLSEIDFGPSPDRANGDADASASIGAEPVIGSLPELSRIQIIDTDLSRMVIYVPSGGKMTRSIGCFALVWNGLMAVFTTAILIGAGPDELGLSVMVPFLSVFWVIGLGMLYWWIRMRFTRLYLMFEQDRLVIQRILFGRKSVRETRLGPESGASLVEAYRQNDDPVYRVAVKGENRTAKFGTSLSIEEKQWFVHRVNEFLGDRAGSVKSTDDLALQCDSCGADLNPNLLAAKEAVVVCPSCGQKIDAKQLALGAVRQDDAEIGDLDPQNLPAEIPIVIEDNSPQRLALSYPSALGGRAKGFAAGFLVVFSLAFSGGSLSALVVGLKAVNGPFDVLFIVVPGLFVLVGLIPSLIALFLFRGRIALDLSPEVLRCRWHLGPLGYRKTVPTESITRIAVGAGFSGERQLAGQQQLASSAGNDRVCLVWAHGKAVPITMFHDAAFARAMAGLMRFHLHRMGFELSDD